MSTNRPDPIEAVETPYKNPPPNNPVLSGLPLSVLSNVIDKVGPLQQFFWFNANFHGLRKLEEAGVLDGFPPRYDPTVLPVPNGEKLEQSYELVRPEEEKQSLGIFYTSADYIAAYKSGATTPTAVAERLYATITSDPHKNSFITVVSKDSLLSAAEASTQRYAAGSPLPLDGVPLAVKDELDISGLPKTLGLSAAEAARRNVGVRERGQTSACVQRLLDAGMLLLGKSNMHEIGLDTLSNNSAWGTPRNPYNKNYYPGGSSGGSGALVGAGICPIAVGADGGGSIRVPSAYCGVFGLKPSHSRVDYRPSSSIAPSVGVIGPIAASADDLAIAYSVMAGVPRSLSPPKQRKIGIYQPWFDDCLPSVLSTCTEAVDTLTSTLGYEKVPIQLPLLSENRLAHALTILTEICLGFCRGDASGLSPANKILVAVARYTPARDFLLAQKMRAHMMSHLAALWKEHPGLLIVTPTTPHAGVEIKAKGHVEKGGAGVSDSNTSLRSMIYVFLANWTGAPAVSVPAGYDKSGVPIGLMAMGEWGDEDALMAFAREWEKEWAGGVVAKGEEGKGRRRGETWVDVLEK